MLHYSYHYQTWDFNYFIQNSLNIPHKIFVFEDEATLQNYERMSSLELSKILIIKYHLKRELFEVASFNEIAKSQMLANNKDIDIHIDRIYKNQEKVACEHWGKRNQSQQHKNTYQQAAWEHLSKSVQ